jgi:UPF0716 protein FxsA
MFLYLFLLLIVLPVAEFFILIKIGMVTAFWVPIAIVLFSGTVGTALARHEGWKVALRVREEMQAGRMPADALIDGFLILVAGVLFVLPGVLSDLVGIVLLFPPSRSLVKRGMRARVRKRVDLRIQRIGDRHWANSGKAVVPDHDQIIDAKVLGTRVEDAKK